jgi:hypothetical protein
MGLFSIIVKSHNIVKVVEQVIQKENHIGFT